MAEQNSGNINFNKEELPIPIPPADQAWQSMRQKLDAELPVEANLPAHVHVRYLWIKRVFVVAAVAAAGIILWQYSRKHNTQLPSSGNNVHDTSLTYKQPAVTRSGSYTLMTDTAFRHAPTATDPTSGVVSTVPSSQPAQDAQSSQTQGSLQSSTPHESTSILSLHRSLIVDRTHPAAGKTTTQTTIEQLAKVTRPLALSASDKYSPKRKTIVKQQATDKQLSMQLANNPLAEERPTVKQQVTNNQLSKSFASGKKRSGKTATTSVSAPLTVQQQQLPVSVHTNMDGHYAGKTESRSALQLSLIQSSVGGYNTSLQHQAAPIVLPQPGDKYTEKRWALYVQLNVALPLYDSSFYFMGPNGKDQFYRRLIPTVRIERKLWKGALSLDVQPSISVTPKSNIHANVDSQLYQFDTTSSLVKQSGWGVALQYHIPVLSKWQVGAGIQASFLQKALIRRTVKDSTMRIIENGVFPASAADKQDLARLHISGIAELDYMAGKWQFGLRTLVPVTRVSKTKDIPARPVILEVVVRRRLWSR